MQAKYRLILGTGKPKQEAGTTLVEVLIACGLTVLLFASVFSMLISSMKSVTLQTDQIDAQQQAQLALSRMEREMRQAQKPFLWQALVPGSYETIIFKADLNSDGTAEAIRYEYQLSTGQLVRQINSTGALDFDTAPRDLLAKYVVNSAAQRVFTYYGTDLNTPLDFDIINKTRLIRVRLIIDKNINKPPAAFDMATDVKLRNFAY
jgi:hypothetical protein